MKKFQVFFSTDNAAFEENEGRNEIARILRDIARRVESGDDFSHFRTIYDSNGNDVGRFAEKDGAQ